MAALARRLSQSPAFNLLVVLGVIGLLMLMRLSWEEQPYSKLNIPEEVSQTGAEASLE